MSSVISVYFWSENQEPPIPHIPRDAESPYICPHYEGHSAEGWEKLQEIIRETPCYKVLAAYYLDGGGEFDYSE